MLTNNQEKQEPGRINMWCSLERSDMSEDK